MNDTNDDHDDLAEISRRSKDVERYYDDWAQAYGAEIESWGYSAPEAVASRLHDLLPPPARVLDVGCGTGLSGRALAARGYEHVDGVDISERSLDLAADTGAYRSARRIDFQALPVPIDDDAYDGLVCVGVLTYLPDTANVLAEFARVVRPGGAVVLTERTDLFDELDFPSVLESLQGRGLVDDVEISEPSAYLPGHDGFGEAIRIRYVSFRVAGSGSP